MVDRVFETERLYARSWTMEDVEAAFKIYSDAEVMSSLQREPYVTLEEQRIGLEAMIERGLAFPDGLGAWAIIEKDTGELVGNILLKPLPNSKLIEVGWHLRRDRWGRGYATEAALAAMRHGFDTLALEKIYAIVHPKNLRSQAVTRRVGLGQIGTTREFHEMELNFYVVDSATFRAQSP